MINRRFRRVAASIAAVAAFGAATPNALTPTAASADASRATTTVVDGWASYTLALTNAQLSDIYAADANHAWAVGRVNPIPTESTILWHFDGIAWSQLSIPDIGAGIAIAGTSASDLWIGGRRGTAHFDGSKWVTHPLPATAVNVVDVYAGGAGAVWAVVAIGAGNHRLARFTAGRWTLVTPSQVDDLVTTQIRFAGTGPNDLWVRYHSGSTVTRLLHWNGTTFTQVPTGLPEQPSGQGFLDLVAVSSTNAWASGITVPSTETKSNPYHWNGTSWQPVDDGEPNTTYRPRVAATGTVWAERTHWFQGYPDPDVVRWIDGRWQEVPGAPVPLVNPVLAYASAGQTGVWALHYVRTASNGNNTQVLNFYSET